MDPRLESLDRQKDRSMQNPERLPAVVSPRYGGRTPDHHGNNPLSGGYAPSESLSGPPTSARLPFCGNRFGPACGGSSSRTILRRVSSGSTAHVAQLLCCFLPSLPHRTASIASRSRPPRSLPLWCICPRTCACNDSMASVSRKRRRPRTKLRGAGHVRFPDDLPYLY